MYAEVSAWRAQKMLEWNAELAPYGLEIAEGTDDRAFGQEWFYIGEK
jgi:hypothetical protein